MITEEQVGKAASRYRRWNNGDLPNPYMSPYFNCDGDDPAYINRDRLILADAYIAELARRDAERAERAKPIDAEWLKTLGFYAGHDLAWHLDRVSCRQYAQHVTDPVESTLLVDDVEVVWHATRGQLLDLLAALNGGA